ncbi:MAG: S8 family serine peptidase [Candidatus Kapaibacteriota bacterium]
MILLLALMIVLAAEPAQSQTQQYAVRLRSASVPSSVQPFVQSRLIPEGVIASKRDADVLSSTQRSMLDDLERWVIVSLLPGDRDRLAVDPAVEDLRPLARFQLHAAPELAALTNDSLSTEQYALPLVGAAAAWTIATGQGIRVGIVDTGIDWEHPDLADQLAVSAAEDVNGNGRFEPWPSTMQRDGIYGDLDGVDNDGNGYVDDVIGYDFVDQSVRNLGDDQMRDPVPFDEQGHGTSVAGVVAARANNQIGIAGLAYNARLVTLRAFDATGNADEDDLAAAIVYAALNGVQVLNYSFGDVVDAPILADAIRFADAMGCVQISSAGNTGTISQQYPASYPEILAVAATNSANQRAPFSSTGTMVGMAAPGQSIITTAVGGRYRSASGTSFAAPYVAATAAMLLQQNPGRTPADIRALLIASSLDTGPTGWDEDVGNGVLRADAALQLGSSGGAGNLVLADLRSNQRFDAGSAPVNVRGSAIMPLQQTYRLLLGRGLSPSVWTELGVSEQAVKNGVLGVLAPAQLPSDRYTLRLEAEQRDGRVIAVHRRIRVDSSTTFAIAKLEVHGAWNTDRRCLSVLVQSTQPSMCRVVVVLASDTLVISSQRRSGRTHTFAIDPAPYASRGTLHVQVWPSGMLSVEAADVAVVDTMVSFDLGNEAAPGMEAWRTTTTAPFAGYLLNDVRDLYGTGAPYFVMSDLSSGGFGRMLTVSRDQQGWGYRDSTSDVWIPRAIGDANGDGQLDVFAHVVGQARLYTAASPGGNPFETTLFSSNDGSRNAAGMADIDGDGVDDLLLLSNDGVEVLAYNAGSGAFESMGLAVNPTAPRPGNLDNRVDEISVAAGDFDNDGRMEIAFGDTDGDLIISEWMGTNFRTEFVAEGVGVGGSGYITAADVDGDGVPEIVHGVPDDPNAGADLEYGRQLWSWCVYRSPRSDAYDTLWHDYFNGVRYGSGYRNGLGAGQLDDVPGDEVILCVFPRLYVFSLRNGRMVPRLYTTGAASPRMLTYDVDNNGRPNLGFGRTAEGIGSMVNVAFLEYVPATSGLPAAAGLRARYVTPDTALVDWMPVQQAERYVVEGFNHDVSAWTVRDTVRGTSVRTAAFSSDAQWSVRVTALPDGAPSSAVSLWYSPEPATFVRVASEPHVTELAQGLQLRIQYSKPLAERGVDPMLFRLEPAGGGASVTGRTVVLASDDTYVVTFPAVDWLTTSVVLSVGGFADLTGFPVMPTSNVSVPLRTAPPAPELLVVGLEQVSATSVTVVFSEPVDASAQDVSAYELLPQHLSRSAISRAERVDDRKVRLLFDVTAPLAALGVTYTITVSNVQSVFGAPITTGAGNSASFVLTASALTNVFAYPQPVRLSTDVQVTFANLTPQATIEILDQRFNRVALITETDANGGASWDLRDGTGTPVPPGVYLYRVKGTVQEARYDSGLGKLMIQR